MVILYMLLESLVGFAKLPFSLLECGGFCLVSGVMLRGLLYFVAQNLVLREEFGTL